MFERNFHVIAAMPYGDLGKVELWTSKRDLLTEKAVLKTLKGSKKFKLLGLERTRKAPPGPVKTGNGKKGPAKEGSAEKGKPTKKPSKKVGKSAR